MGRHKRIVGPTVDKMVREPEQSGPELAVPEVPKSGCGTVRVVCTCSVTYLGKMHKQGSVIDIVESDFERFKADNIFQKQEQ